MENKRPITLLSQEVIGKIAAGEVVERPAAAIKELVENSLDAGASAITVEIRDGGISYFRVTDNGSGIPQKEIRLAFERHATSKIRKAEDLSHIATLGFRGEALASIAAVSKVQCTTRTQADEHGISVKNEGGVIQDIRDAACPEGTTFVVRDLFYNTPVRLKFLKKPAYEASLVSDLIMRLILSRPGVSFRFINQGKTVYHSAGDGQISSAVYSIYGREMLHSMRLVSGAMNGIMMEGYVGIGDSARGNRGHQSFFINGRYMKSMVLTQALEKACRERVTIGHYPICVLYLTIPYDQVDVNVHPNKLEVRFARENALYEAVDSIIFQVLDQDTPFKQIPELQLGGNGEHVGTIQVERLQKIPESVQNNTKTDRNIEKQIGVQSNEAQKMREDEWNEPKFVPKELLGGSLQRNAGEAVLSESHAALAAPHRLDNLSGRVQPPVQPPARETVSQAPSPSMECPSEKSPAGFQAPRPRPVEPEAVQQAFAGENHQAAEAGPASMEILGAAFQTYILVEYGDRLLLIDQHAAHERLLYDQMMKAFDQHTASQALLVPQAVTLTYREMETFTQYQQALKDTGFDVESFGDRTVQIRGVPMILGDPQAKEFFLDLMDQLENLRGLNTLEKRRNAILQQACKHAVKGGERLPRAVIEDLVRQMAAFGVTPTCPHGRPLVVAITRRDLEKRFSRIQT